MTNENTLSTIGIFLAGLAVFVLCLVTLYLLFLPRITCRSFGGIPIAEINQENLSESMTKCDIIPNNL